MQDFAGGESPVLDEDFLELRDDWAFEAEVRVVERGARRRLQAEHCAFADIEAAGKADRAIDDQDLAVAAHVAVGERAGEERAHEPIGANADAAAGVGTIEGNV